MCMKGLQGGFHVQAEHVSDDKRQFCRPQTHEHAVGAAQTSQVPSTENKRGENQQLFFMFADFFFLSCSIFPIFTLLRCPFKCPSFENCLLEGFCSGKGSYL